MKNRSFLLVLAALTNLSLLAASEIKVGSIRYAINDSTRSAAVIAINRNDCIGSAVIVPDSIHYHDTAYPVTEILEGAFTRCGSISCITLPKTISRINKESFSLYRDIDTIRFAGTLSEWLTKEWDPSIVSKDYALLIGSEILTSLVIPEGTDTIKADAFAGCSSLMSVSIPASVRHIGDNAFRGIPNINYHGDLQSSNDWGARWRNAYVDGYLVYRNDSMTTILDCLPNAHGIVTIPDGVTRIEEEAFYERHPYSVIVPNSVEYIGDDAFFEIYNVEYHGKAKGKPWGARHINYYVENNLAYKDNTKREIIECLAYSIDSVHIPNSVTKIRPYAFAGCQYIGVLHTGNGMKKIGKGVFNTEGYIDSVIISDAVQQIDKHAFNSVRSMVLGASVKRLGENWIESGVGNIYSYARSVPNAGFSFFAEEEGISLYVPKQMAYEYVRFSYWRKFDIHTMDTVILEEKNFTKYDPIGTNDSIGLICRATGDTVFPPIYRGIRYSNWDFVVIDQDDHATAYNRNMVCLIPASQGYADIVGEGVNCSAWVGFKLDDAGEPYVYAVCNWKGEEIFLPKGKYSYIVPRYDQKRVYYTVVSKDTGKTFIIDSDENNCSVKNFPETTKFKYIISIPDITRDESEDDDFYDYDDYDKYYKKYTIEFIPQSPNPYPIVNYNRLK